MTRQAAIEDLNALGADEIARRLCGPRADVAAFVRAAAEAGSAEAQARIGQMLLDGDGVAKDAAAGFAWFERAAYAGHLEAANMVGRCYDLGWGVGVDKRQAAAWFRQAAARGLTWAKYNYATLLALGQGVAEDKATALALFEEAAAEGNAKAHNFVGSFHEDGWVVERDMAEAARRYAIAAAGGDFRGQFNHGRMRAIEGRTEEALHWIGLAWENGNGRFRAQMIDYLLALGEPFRSAIAKLREQSA
ncbi:MAG TPA: sel1 repeat family protein [Sphingomonas sp.]|uniref:tetratricopeptide repeat protein n=1 Tax=Sphingomonas sp. TaxID=28214 RepID=UPI002C262969|nr:sel1 repeat family protein [Sphingomonas sp.]HMI19482.1 sel1 repeat family protein [Sphingomonas sp.]